MLTIARLFGKSPFSPLQSHMKKVSSCIKKLSEVFDQLAQGKQDQLESLVNEVSKLEHEADLTKNDIRNHLPKSLFLPIDRAELLEILSIQDDIADQAEKIGHLLTLYPLETPPKYLSGLNDLFVKNCDTFWITRQIIKEMGDLLESSFGGKEAERVKGMAEETSFKEYQADKAMHKLQREFFQAGESFSTPVFYLFNQLILEINHISHISEQLANRIRMIIEVK